MRSAAASNGQRELLDLADSLLDGEAAVRGSVAVRGAAVVARQVLEQTVERRCRELAGDTDRTSSRSKLILLSELADPVFSTAAKTAWHGLSRACHHHSYELTPGFAEVRELIGLVRSLLE